MATKFVDGKSITRDMEIDGMSLKVTFDAAGVTFRRKGDKHKDPKAMISVSWGECMGVGEERLGVEAENYLGFNSPTLYGRLPGGAVEEGGEEMLPPPEMDDPA